MFRNAHHNVLSKFYKSMCGFKGDGGGGGGEDRGQKPPWKITNGSSFLRNTSCSTDPPREAIRNFGELGTIVS